MNHLSIGTLAVLFALAIPGPAPGQDPLAPAKELYAAAQYEEALKALDALAAASPPAAVVLPLHQHRALCLLALSRKADAERAIEAVLDLDPFYQPGEDEAAPWVRAAFRDVRQRVLPGALQQLYGRAKQAFDRKAWPEAASSFRDVLKLLDDPDLPLDKGAQADLRMVVQGFLDLADAASTMAAPPKPVPPPLDVPTAGAGEPAAKPAPSSPAPAEDPTVVYDSTASDVIPPLPLREVFAIPEAQWPIGNPKEGSFEIVIGRTGEVESAQIRQALGGAYDAFVLRAASGWRYRPAMKNGKPVRYRRLVRVVIPGR